ncbi:hypothetical protein [Salinibaculum rarum]|uniref:hypothetical protein n=1 Tax=Salinibaculum rarum TaxID=3058903 RepID=UPI00265EE904|nr:hypothetical protein [Salinibaculum sp. KK48]
MSSAPFPEDDAVEITNRIPGAQLQSEIKALLTDPTWESPTTIQVTPSVAVQIARLLDPGHVGASVEILVKESAVGVDELISVSDQRRRIEEQMLTQGGITEEEEEVLANLPTRGVEIPAIAPVCSVVQGILLGVEDYDVWVESSYTESAPVHFTYAFPVTPEAGIRGAAGLPYDQGRENPFDEDALVFATAMGTTYSAEDMPDELLSEEWARRHERPVEDAQSAPDPKTSDTEVGDVFYNTNTDEYCWVLAFDPTLGVLLQYEDGTFWDQQLRDDGVPAGPYEDRDLPEDYSGPIPNPDDPCDVENHVFPAENPTSYHDLEDENGICGNCGLSTMTLMELYNQWPYNHAEYSCVGCGTTGPGEELIGRLEEVAVCEECWDESQTPRENYQRLTDS